MRYVYGFVFLLAAYALIGLGTMAFRTAEYITHLKQPALVQIPFVPIYPETP